MPQTLISIKGSKPHGKDQSKAAALAKKPVTAASFKVVSVKMKSKVWTQGSKEIKQALELGVAKILVMVIVTRN